jgi:uncharacterized membrane protein (DUF106 family)
MLNFLLRSLTDALLSPFRPLPAIVGLTVISIVFAIVALYIFKWTSNQDKIEAVKRKIFAGLFEIRLFNDDLKSILRAMFDIFRHNASYVGLSLPPLLVMIVPFVLVIAQLQFQYGYEGLRPGDEAVVQVVVKSDAGAGERDKPGFELLAPEGLNVRSPSMWAYPIGTMSWVVEAQEWGTYEIELQWTDDAGEAQKVTKSVVVSEDEIQLRSPSRLAHGFWNQLLYPGEDPLPAESPFESIEINYNDADMATYLFGFRTHWLLIFLVLSIVLAFVLAKPLGIKL